MSYALGYSGIVSDVNASNPINTAAPFSFSYKYDRKDYSEWVNKRITPPLPPLGLPWLNDEHERSGEPVELDAPDVVWVADITYIRLLSNFVYLATILDAYSRKCVGWNLSKRIDTQLALGALEQALATRDVRPGLIHHSDRGVQYASTAYAERLQSVQAHISMSAVGNPYDNAKAESFFKTLKQEEVYLKQYQTFEEAQSNIGQFLEDVYNTKRLHSSLGYVPPAEFEMAYAQDLRY